VGRVSKSGSSQQEWVESARMGRVSKSGSSQQEWVESARVVRVSKSGSSQRQRSTPDPPHLSQSLRGHLGAPHGFQAGARGVLGGKLPA